MKKFEAQLSRTVVTTASVTVEVPDDADDDAVDAAIHKAVSDDDAKSETDRTIEWDLNSDDVDVEETDEVTE